MTTARTSSTKQRVIVVARQAGSANALAPVVLSLRDEFQTEVAVFAFEQAFRTFQRLKCEAIPIASAAAVVDSLVSHGAEVLLTGTSLCVEEDAAVWARARAAGIPSIALLDHWCNYWERFTPSQSEQRFAVTPDRIAVMDAAALQAMIEAGCPEELLVVTGQPAFDELLNRSWPLDLVARHELGVPPEAKLVVFASEPQVKDYGDRPEVATFLGYTEDDVLRLLLQALSDPDFADVQLLVKPHPTETVERLQAVLEREKLPVQARLMTAEADPKLLLGAADAVVGMTSIMLFEAALMGRPAASLRPGARHGCDLVEMHPGLIANLKDSVGLHAWLRDSLLQHSTADRRREFQGQRSATQSVIDLINDLSSRPQVATELVVS